MRKGNIDKVALALGISQRRVHGLAAEGVIPHPKDGRHDVPTCRKLYKAYKLASDKTFRIQKERERAQRDLDAGRPVRWSIELAAEEFGLSEALLRRRLRQIGLSA